MLPILVSYDGTMSIPADPPCAPGVQLIPDSVAFKAQEKSFCDQVHYIHYTF